jgi:hypothetical protein
MAWLVLDLASEHDLPSSSSCLFELISVGLTGNGAHQESQACSRGLPEWSVTFLQVGTLLWLARCCCVGLPMHADVVCGLS